MAKKKAKTFEFKVDEESDLPLWVQLRNRVAHLIDSGYYAPGEQLPTVRALASDISVNYNTVNKAYLNLKSDGYIVSTQGRGAFVRDVPPTMERSTVEEVDGIMDDCIDACRGLGLSLDEVQTAMNRRISHKRYAEHPESGTIVDFGRVCKADDQSNQAGA
ncbi:MAG: GntR family transcriptional regulator [Eggerthellaceae bacterium]|jgi:GntR family transcriptional regulator